MENTPSVTLGLIGYGALARQIVAALSGKPVRWIALVRGRVSSDLPDGIETVSDVAGLMSFSPRLVVEVAGQSSVAAFVPSILTRGIPVLVASVGALADEQLSRDLRAAEKTPGARLIIASGAIGGLDYLSAISRLPGAHVRYTLKKPPSAWADVLAERGIRRLDQPLQLFEGAPRDAAKLFPKNTNAAFTAAAAASPAAVSVCVIADPALSENVHEIEVTSSAGRAFFSFHNAPSPGNPKTSAVTALSLVAEIRKFLDQHDVIPCPTS